MRAKVKELLQPIIDEINSGSEVGDDLWFLLTALRGPDDQSLEGKLLKHDTTARLRYALGFRDTEIASYRFDLSELPLPKQSELGFESYSDPNRHFRGHFRLAVEAFETTDK